MNDQRSRRGSVLPVCMVMAAGIGAVLSTFLGRTLVEQRRVGRVTAQERSAWRAIGELELAFAFVGAACNLFHTSRS